MRVRALLLAVCATPAATAVARSLAALGFLAAAFAHAADADHIVKTVRFAQGSTSAVLKDSIVGRRYVDYRLRAAAGQTLKASLDSRHRAAYFNLLSPGSENVAMYIGQHGENRFEGLLPDDGVYTLRVYLMRSAARRDERAAYTLHVAVTGKPLAPVSAKVDAVIPGTPFHARTTVACAPAYSKARECEAFVVRRGFDGTATVELRWKEDGRRRILFVKGKPEAADTPQPLAFTRDERGYAVMFGGDERFEIPEALVFGG